MEGGIQAWHGLTADGPPEGGVAYFASGTDAADMAALAWALEENTRLFYSDLAKMRPGTDEADLFMKLVSAEKHHKETLFSINGKLRGEPVDRFYRRQSSPILEGGVGMEEVLSWARDKPAKKILRITMGFEANAYDRYLKMVDVSESDDAKEVFRTIAREEKGHLRKLGELLDQVTEKQKQT
ncbi:MAG: ferritin family protein [bacterium]|nr:ferritin family protein [bacterium]MDT8366358.1 ferritin family protein [bacterium]